jgi:hypothetical protein
MECSDQQSSVKSQQNARVNSTFHPMEITDTNARRLLYLQLVRSNFSYATQAWSPQSVKLIEDIEKVQRRGTKHILNVGFITAFLRRQDSFSLKYYLFHIGTSTWIWCSSTRSLTILHTYIDERALPIMAWSGITRSESNANLIRFVIPYAKTVTFQTSFFIRTCKTWNLLHSNLRARDIGLLSFKSGLKLYYKHALSTTFKCDNSRTWNSVCVKCKRARSLNNVISCC